MPDPAPNPQDVFHSLLPVGTSLLTIFIPSKDRDGKPIDQDLWVEEVLTSLGKLFRGATAYPRGRGVWRDDEKGGTLIREEPVIVFSYAAENAVTVTALSALYKTLSKMGRDANQGEVGLVLDGRYYGITEYREV